MNSLVKSNDKKIKEILEEDFKSIKF